MSRFRQLLRIGSGFFPYLKKPLSVQDAFEQLRARVADRERRFLDLAKLLIYSQPGNPYLKLLQHAGCAFADLQESVRSHGLESTLEKLRDAGVQLSVEEFKSKVPICRKGLTIETTATDFDNPYLMGRSLEARTSGSTAAAARVLYDWNFFAEEAANEMLLHEIHGVGDSPEAFWYPGFPSISGVHNLLVHLKFRKPPNRWFSQLEGSIQSRMLMIGLSMTCRFLGLRVPLPQTTHMEQADSVASWMAQHRPSCLKAFASSAVRVVQAAKNHNMDISGSVIFTGGEPLTARRRDYIESAGVRVYPRYVTTETGLVGAGCNKAARGSMHLYTDRLAVIRKSPGDAAGTDRLLFSTLSSHTGKVLLNTDLGDAGGIRSEDCSCLFGQAGMRTLLEGIQNYDKITSEGMTVLASSLDAVVGKLVADMGGGPDDYQFWEAESEHGNIKVMIVVSPAIRNLVESFFRDEVLQRLRSEGVAAGIASEFWKQADALEVVRDQPRISAGFKHFGFVKGIPPNGSRKS